jgi:hypothetical protein
MECIEVIVKWDIGHEVFEDGKILEKMKREKRWIKYSDSREEYDSLLRMGQSTRRHG